MSKISTETCSKKKIQSSGPVQCSIPVFQCTVCTYSRMSVNNNNNLRVQWDFSGFYPVLLMCVSLRNSKLPSK